MTIKDIAEYCGVSVSTVSRVLNGRPDVSDTVRSKILNAIRDLHYVPNNSARALGQSQSDSIGVVVRGGTNPFYTSLIHSVEDAIHAAGYSMSISHIPSYADEVAAGASLATAGRLAGLIFLGGCFDYDNNRMASINVPYVCCTFTNSFGYLPDEVYSSVSIDDRTEARRAVEYLISHGHRRIAILLDSKDDRSIGQLRYMGYCDALQDAGIAIDQALVKETGEYEMDAAYNSMKEMLDHDPGFTAVFVIADSLAIAAMKAIFDSGKSIPQDISMIAIDGLVMSKYTNPTLTTIVQPTEILGEKAVKTLVDVIRQSGVHQHLRVAAEIRTGGTVRDI